MAMTFAAYAVPEAGSGRSPPAVVVVLALVNCAGVTRTAGLTRIIVTLVLGSLAVAVAACFGGGDAHGLGLEVARHGAYGVLQSAGLLFFAFAGYARIATLGEEVRDPARVIPRAILVALAGAVVVYAVVGVAVLACSGPRPPPPRRAPVADAVAATSWAWAVSPSSGSERRWQPPGRCSRWSPGSAGPRLAMAREGDLPRWLAAVHPRFQVPHRAELTRRARSWWCWCCSSTCAARSASRRSACCSTTSSPTSPRVGPGTTGQRRYPRWWQLVGAAGCVVLVATLPWQSVVAGIAVFVVGIGWRLARLRSAR